jgi:hypothetical protein
MKKKEEITRRGRQICPCGEEGSSRKGSPGGRVHDGPYVSVNGGEVAVPDGWLDWLAAGRETTHAHAVSLSSDKGQGQEATSPHLDWLVLAPLSATLHVWGKVEEGNIRWVDFWVEDGAAAIASNSKSGLVRPCPRKYH